MESECGADSMLHRARLRVVHPLLSGMSLYQEIEEEVPIVDKYNILLEILHLLPSFPAYHKFAAYGLRSWFHEPFCSLWPLTLGV